jgi:hypothetical protein
MTHNNSEFVVTFFLFLLIVGNTGSFNTGKPRVDLKQEELQRLYAPVVAAHGNRTTLRELAGASQDVHILDIGRPMLGYQRSVVRSSADLPL